jgi:glucose/arabinose dehydrogenase
VVQAQVRAQQVGTFDKPTDVQSRPGTGALYVVEKTGRVRAVADRSVVVDVSGNVSQGTEQGLLGLAFSPDGRLAYVNWTDRNGDTHVAEHDMAAPPTALRELLFVDQPYANHNGGGLAFGPDGLLYIGLGDGGSQADPNGNAQNLGVVLGKMLRIDPRPSGSMPYTVPPSNPFVGRPGARPEVWAFGLRNPWRYWFDRPTGDLWIGDVGQNQWEEIDRQPGASKGGENYGWVAREGTHQFKGAAPPGAVDPVFEYSHDGGNCSLTLGPVYRGRALSGYDGTVFFADYCAGDLRLLRQAGGRWVDTSLRVHVDEPSAFGVDGNGEVLVTSLEGGLYRLVPA